MQIHRLIDRSHQAYCPVAGIDVALLRDFFLESEIYDHLTVIA